MTREQIVECLDRLMCHLTYPELDDLHALNEELCCKDEEIARLKALNEWRASRGESQAYDDEAFFQNAEEFTKLKVML